MPGIMRDGAICNEIDALEDHDQRPPAAQVPTVIAEVAKLRPTERMVHDKLPTAIACMKKAIAATKVELKVLHGKQRQTNQSGSKGYGYPWRLNRRGGTRLVRSLLRQEGGCPRISASGLKDAQRQAIPALSHLDHPPLETPMPQPSPGSAEEHTAQKKQPASASIPGAPALDEGPLDYRYEWILRRAARSCLISGWRDDIDQAMSNGGYVIPVRPGKTHRNKAQHRQKKTLLEMPTHQSYSQAASWDDPMRCVVYPQATIAKRCTQIFPRACRISWDTSPPKLLSQ